MIKQHTKNNKWPENYEVGKSRMIFLAWLLMSSLFFNILPRPFYAWRAFLLRIFGAKIGKNVKIRPGVVVEFPWKLEIGDGCSIGDNAWLYNLDYIKIGNNCVISQYAKIITGSHLTNSADFDLIVAPVIIEDNCWIGADSFISLGVTVGEGAVIGARAEIFKNVAKHTICKNEVTYKIRTRKQH